MKSPINPRTRLEGNGSMNGLISLKLWEVIDISGRHEMIVMRPPIVRIGTRNPLQANTEAIPAIVWLWEHFLACKIFIHFFKTVFDRRLTDLEFD